MSLLHQVPRSYTCVAMPPRPAFQRIPHYIRHGRQIYGSRSRYLRDLRQQILDLENELDSLEQSKIVYARRTGKWYGPRMDYLNERQRVTRRRLKSVQQQLESAMMKENVPASNV